MELSPCRTSDDMQWPKDADVNALSKLKGWAEFHRTAGLVGLYFDRPMKAGRNYTCLAFTVKRNTVGGWQSYRLSEGSARTPLDAMAEAYRESGRGNDALNRLWDQVCGVAATNDEMSDDFASIFD